MSQSPRKLEMSSYPDTVWAKFRGIITSVFGEWESYFWWEWISVKWVYDHFFQWVQLVQTRNPQTLNKWRTMGLVQVASNAQLPLSGLSLGLNLNPVCLSAVQRGGSIELSFTWENFCSSRPRRCFGNAAADADADADSAVEKSPKTTINTFPVKAFSRFRDLKISGFNFFNDFARCWGLLKSSHNSNPTNRAKIGISLNFTSVNGRH